MFHGRIYLNSVLLLLLVNFGLLLAESLVIVIFYVIFLAIIIILEKKVFLIKRKQGVSNCFKPLFWSVFTTVASRLNSEQKEKAQ